MSQQCFMNFIIIIIIIIKMTHVSDLVLATHKVNFLIHVTVFLDIINNEHFFNSTLVTNV